ncbi:ribosomal RNA processing protein 1 homolog B-like isoform X2 [Entelurus aequoreus]|uniref:ribosomal RNA processing protein 1 homolog B-like isoform X2 n=1 Tax=Entelurus aequoreus TaxID=161455 RepID=UPI002B1D6E1E|nr:ribosomal RNA processing protein 1 homolog B-like isoform X2 [Entelurus aequoreus]
MIGPYMWVFFVPTPFTKCREVSDDVTSFDGATHVGRAPERRHTRELDNMAAVQALEIQLAQKLASNEKPIRTKALKKLRKYINVRSQKATDGFTSEELLKLWKGLFYCLWMQDKPLLQEVLSNSVSSLIHSFHDVNGQFLYVESFFKTFKREWTGIDRLRMDKFFQLVRFMFRQTFEMLKKTNWESSVVERFLQLLTTELLLSSSNAPTGLQLHVLDLYLTELAAVGSAELTSDQNLIFIKPFCKTAAKTKNRTLFQAICNSIFSTIIDQAPFAIEDLMKEIKATESSDSGQSSEGEEAVECKDLPKLMNGRKSCHDDGDIDPQSGDSDTELYDDDEAAPVLQFDYAALADKLLEMSSHSHTHSYNRQRLYKIIKVLRDLSEGIFPQDEYPEEVSTDEDDDMFASRKKMKKRRRIEMESGKKASKPKQSVASSKDGMEPTDPVVLKKQKKKKRKACRDECASGDPNAKSTNEEHAEFSTQSKIRLNGSEDEAKMQPFVSALDEADKPNRCIINKDQPKKKKMNKKMKVLEPKVEELAKPQTCTTQGIGTGITEQENSSKPNVVVSVKTDAKLKSQSDTVENLVDCEMSENSMLNEAQSQPINPARRKKKGLKAEKVKDDDGHSQLSTIQTKSIPCEDSKDDGTGMTDTTASAKKNKRKKLVDKTPIYESATKAELAAVREEAKTNKQEPILQKTDHTPEEKTPELLHSTSQSPTDGSPSSSKKKRQRRRNKSTTAVQAKKEVGESQLLDVEPMSSDHHVASSLKNTQPSAQVEEVKDETQLLNWHVDEPMVGDEELSFSEKKKKKIPVVFEFEADELEVNNVAKAAAGIKKIKTRQTPTSDSKKVTFHLKNNKTAEFKKNDRSLLLSPEGSSKVPFDPKQKPKFGVLKASPKPLSASIKKTAKINRKRALSAPNSAPKKRRPSAADFF